MMDEGQIKAIIRSQIESATGNDSGELSEKRRRNLEYYHGEPFGNEVDGQSQVVSTDVADTVESILPDLMQIFSAGDEVVRFEPYGREDEEFAKQATDYINFIWTNDNEGFNVFHDWFKDALLQVNGFIKVYWDDTPWTEKRFYTGLSEDELAILIAEDEVEVLEHTEYPAMELPAEIAVLQEAVPVLHDIKIERTQKRGRVKVETVPPEEILVERRARDLETASFVCHKTRKTVSDLIQSGFDRDLVEGLPSSDEHEYNEERVARFQLDGGAPFTDNPPDESTREVWVYESYIRLDADEDGVSELRRIVTAGPGYTLLENDEADMCPIVSVAPIRMPHKFYGRSIAELVTDIQLIKSTIWRQSLDNMYNQNNARPVISNKVELDDILTNKVGAPIRVNSEAPDVSGHVVYSQTPSIMQHALPMIEYADTVREARTGVTRYGQGLDADSLNKTATGVNQILGRQQQRILLIARIFAEGGVKDAFRKILRLVVENQDKERTIRLRNEWVTVDPRSWNAEMDVSMSVGIGHGTQQEKLAGIAQIIQQMKEAVAFQGGLDGPLVNGERLMNALKEFSAQIGYRSTDRFWPTAEELKQPQPQKPPQPDPKMIEVQAKAQQSQAEFQHKTQIDVQEHQLDQQKAQAQAQTDRERMLMDAQLKREIAENDMAIKAWEAQQRIALDAGKFDLDVAKADLDDDRKASKEAAHFALHQEMEAIKAERTVTQKAEPAVQVNNTDSKVFDGLSKIAKGMEATTKAMTAAVEQMSAPKEVVWDGDKPTGIRVVK